MFRSLSVAAVVLTAGLSAAAEIKSGPQPGDSVPGPFAPLNINGETPDQKQCLYCRNGDNPVAVIFARTADCPQTAKLIKAIDAATAENKKSEMGSYVVFCSDEENLDKKLKEMVKAAGIKEDGAQHRQPERPRQVQDRQGRRPDRGAVHQAEGRHQLRLQEGRHQGTATSARSSPT